MVNKHQLITLNSAIDNILDTYIPEMYVSESRTDINEHKLINDLINVKERLIAEKICNSTKKIYNIIFVVTIELKLNVANESEAILTLDNFAQKHPEIKSVDTVTVNGKNVSFCITYVGRSEKEYLYEAIDNIYDHMSAALYDIENLETAVFNIEFNSLKHMIVTELNDEE